MKFLPFIALGAVSTALGASVDGAEPKFLLEFSRDETRWVTQEEKWTLRQEGKTFFDITRQSKKQGFKSDVHIQAPIQYPKKAQFVDKVSHALAELSKENMEKDLVPFTEFHNRHYKNETGVEAAKWLAEQVETAVSGASGATVELFEHADFPQNSVIARIPGKSEELVIVGAHMDSIDRYHPEDGRAPGADDNGSGTVTVLEILRGILQVDEVAQGNAAHTIEFHWYAGEEEGLLGSQDIFEKYQADAKTVRGMLNLDMTGYRQGLEKNNQTISLTVITDDVNEDLTELVKTLIAEYTDLPHVEKTCDYACSDHASANASGFPAAYMTEAPIKYSNPQIHTHFDTLELVNYDHMLEHAKAGLGFVTELALAE